MIILKEEKTTTDNLKIITELHKDKYVLKFITKYNKELYPHPIREEINICLDDYKEELANEINETEFSFEKDYTIQQENAIKKQFVLSATNVLLDNYDDLSFSEIEKDKSTGRVLSKVKKIETVQECTNQLKTLDDIYSRLKENKTLNLDLTKYENYCDKYIEPFVFMWGIGGILDMTAKTTSPSFEEFREYIKNNLLPMVLLQLIGAIATMLEQRILYKAS